MRVRVGASVRVRVVVRVGVRVRVRAGARVRVGVSWASDLLVHRRARVS